MISLTAHATIVLHCIIHVFLTHETFGVKSRTSFNLKKKFRMGGGERERKARKGHQVLCRTVISCVGITGSMTRDLEFLTEIKPEQLTFCFFVLFLPLCCLAS